MRPKTALILLASAILMAGFVFQIEPRLAAKYRVRTPQRVFPEITPEIVSSVRVIFNLTNELNVIRSNGSWYITEPISYPAAAETIETLLRVLAELDFTASIGEIKSEQLPEFGLQPPKYTLTINVGSLGKTIYVGNQTPFQDKVYIQPSDKNIVILASQILSKCLPTTIDDWRDRSIFLAREIQCNRLLLLVDNTPVELELHPPLPRWRIVKPINARANTSKVNRMLEQIASARVKKFIADSIPNNLEDYGLLPPKIEIAPAIDSNVINKIRLGGPANETGDEIYALRESPPLFFTVATYDVQDCLTKMDALRDPRLIEFSPDQIQALQIVATSRFRVERGSNGEWQVNANQVWNADTQLVALLQQVLCNMEVFQFVKQIATEYDLPAYGITADSPRYIIHLDPAKTGQPNPTSIELQFGKIEGNRVFVRRTDETSIYAIRLADYNRLAWAPFQLRDRRAWSFNVDQVSRVTVKEGPRNYEFLRLGTNNWVQNSGPRIQINPFAIEETIYRLGELTMVAWVAIGKESLPQFGISDDPDAVTVETKDGKTYRLAFGGPTPYGSLYGAVEIEGTIWIGELPRAICEFVKTYLTASESDLSRP